MEYSRRDSVFNGKGIEKIEFDCVLKPALSKKRMFETSNSVSFLVWATLDS